MSFLAEFFRFLKSRKKVFFLPLVLAVVLLGALMLVAQSSAVAPFIYSLF
jgi:hypothetical protein